MQFPATLNYYIERHHPRHHPSGDASTIKGTLNGTANTRASEKRSLNGSQKILIPFCPEVPGSLFWGAKHRRSRAKVPGLAHRRSPELPARHDFGT